MNRIPTAPSVFAPGPKRKPSERCFAIRLPAEPEGPPALGLDGNALKQGVCDRSFERLPEFETPGSGSAVDAAV